MEMITSGRKRQSELKGRIAENLVAASWQGRGFQVLAQRLRTPAGEIDLVVADAETLVFVEVKARHCHADAAYAVLPRQQKRLLEAAEIAMATNPDWYRPSARFDVALVAGGVIEQIEDALRP
jgi:putative endonuclease